MRIHRGAEEVGGNCVELESGGYRLLLDLGLPLNTEPDEDTPLPDVVGLDGADDSLLGVVISHGHPDHYGLLSELPQGVPVFLGQATREILRQAAFFSTSGAAIEASDYLRDGEPLDLGPFRLTPFLVDHSAFDAYALLVEAGERRLFYTGDLRGHGRKRRSFERLLRSPPEGVHAMLLEGTKVGAGSREADGLSEEDVEAEATEIARTTKGMVLALYSPQNIDRLVSLYRAAKRSGRLFVMDLYCAAIAAATGRETIPQADWEGVRVFVPLSQRIKVKEAQAFERVAAVRKNRLYPEELAARAPDLVMTFRGSMAAELERAGCLTDAQAIWSLWPGYLDQPSGARLQQFLDRHSIPVSLVHSSGHATVEDLQRLAEAIAPERIVPIHTTASRDFPDFFMGVEPHRDGEWWAV